MTTLLIFVILVLGVVVLISSTRWKLSKDLKRSLDESSFFIYRNKTVSASAQLALGESLAIPIKSTVLINEREMHLIPNKFSPLLFMTDFPFTFYRKDNKKLKLERSDYSGIVFVSQKRNPSMFGKVFEVRIEVYDDEKREMLKKIKNWR